MKFNRKILLILLASLVLATIDAGSYLLLNSAKDRADRAVADAAYCQQLAAKIMVLKAKPAVAGTQERAFEELTQRIQSAANQSGITADHLASIAPESPVRISEMAYLERPTTIELRDATLPQIVGLMCALSNGGGGLQIKALRLTAPAQKGDGDLWSAELTVTYLIYAPLPRQPNDAEKS